MAMGDRLFSLLRSKDFAVSIITIKGRIKPKLVLGEYQRTVLQKPVKSARLIMRKAGIFLKIFVVYDVPLKEAAKPVGVDVGIRKLLVGSNALQSVAAPSWPAWSTSNRFCTLSAPKAPPLLRGGKNGWPEREAVGQGHAPPDQQAFCGVTERRRICSFGGIARCQERDNGIAAPCKDHPAAFRGWAISRLLHMLSYKCADAGVPVVYVSPDFTSQRCPRCGTHP